MRKFSEDEDRIIRNYGRCPNCEAENFFDNAEFFKIKRKVSYMIYSKCLECRSTYRHTRVPVNNERGWVVFNYHISISTFLEKSLKLKTDEWCEEIGLEEFRMD